MTSLSMLRSSLRLRSTLNLPSANSRRCRNLTQTLSQINSRPYSAFEGEEVKPPASVVFDVYKEHPNRKKLPQAEIDAMLSKKQIVASEPVNPETSFAELGVHESLRSHLAGKFDNPTLIQQITLPVGLRGRDLVGLAETGSGKTLSFAIPLIEHVLANSKNRRSGYPLALVIVPTRELAMQVFEEVQKLARLVGLNGAVLYGGSSVFAQSRALRSASDFVVGTPGRLMDFGERGYANLSRATFVVMDEADRMLDMGFKRELSTIIGMTPKRRQLTMWSATWDSKLSDVASGYINNPFMVKVGSGDITVNPNITQKFRFVSNHVKDQTLIKIICAEENKNKSFLVFCNRIFTTLDVVQSLTRERIKAVSMSGRLTQADRERNLGVFKKKLVSVLVATDVASRGIDVKNIDYVINYDFPDQIESYVHRIGRTGRAGAKGTSISFMTRADIRMASAVRDVLTRSGQEIPEELYDFESRDQGY